MYKFTQIALFVMMLVIEAASNPALAVDQRNVAAGEGLARELVRLMDTDKNGQVSRQEFMRFMEAEFDRLDVDHSGELTVKELSKFPSLGPACICHFGYGGDQCVTAVSCTSEGGRCIRSCPSKE